MTPQISLVVKEAWFTAYDLQWFGRERERLYLVARARGIHETRLIHQRLPTTPVPKYLKTRIAAGLPLPGVESKPLPRDSLQSARKRGRGPNGHARGGLREEERVANLAYVIQGLNEQLYVELMCAMKL
jgi:hypothetical protein